MLNIKNRIPNQNKEIQINKFAAKLKTLNPFLPPPTSTNCLDPFHKANITAVPFIQDKPFRAEPSVTIVPLLRVLCDSWPQNKPLPNLQVPFVNSTRGVGYRYDPITLFRKPPVSEFDSSVPVLLADLVAQQAMGTEFGEQVE